MLKQNNNNTFYEIILYINVTLYALCYQLKRPIEPFLISSLKAEDAVLSYGALQSFFSLIQTIGSPIMGMIIDRYSSKFGFFVAFAASATSYGLLSIATSLNLLYLSVIPTAFQHGFLCAQAVAVNLFHDEEGRAAALGRLTAAYCIGATIGPAIGGYLGANKDYYLGARLACLGSILSCLLTLIGPGGGDSNRKRTSSDDENEQEKDSEKKSPPSMFKGLRIALSAPKIRTLILIKLLVSCGNGVMGAAVPLILKNTFGFDEQRLGLYFSITSLSTTIFSALTSRKLWISQSPKAIIQNCVILVGLGFTMQGLLLFSFEKTTLSSKPYITSLWLLSGIIASLASHTLAIFITTMSTSLVDSNDRGSLIGLEHGIFSVSRIVTPGIGVAILKYGDVSSVGFVCAIFTIFAFFVLCDVKI